MPRLGHVRVCLSPRRSTPPQATPGKRTYLPRFNSICLDCRRTMRGGIQVLQELRAIQCWPLWLRLTLVWVGLGSAFLLQFPPERGWPGEPFLLFLLVVIGTTLCFG